MRTILIALVSLHTVECFAEERHPKPLEPGEIQLLIEKRRLIEREQAALELQFKRFQNAQLDYQVLENDMKTKREAADCRITAAFTIDCTSEPPKPAYPSISNSGASSRLPVQLTPPANQYARSTDGAEETTSNRYKGTSASRTAAMRTSGFRRCTALVRRQQEDL